MLSFQPGQYAAIGFNKGIRPSAMRCFSIASSPTEQEFVEFGIRVGGRFTKALQKLKTGDLIHVEGPYGNFIFNSAEHKHVILCAGGIGITPFMSMIRYASNLRLNNQLILFFSARSQDDIPYFDEIKKLAHSNHNLQIVFIIDGDNSKINYPLKAYSGRLNADIISQNLTESPDKYTAFMCGPPPFMKAVGGTLSTLGLPKERIITEAFSQSTQHGKGHSRSLPTNVYILGAIGTLACTVLVMANDMFKTIPSTILPEKLTDGSSGTSNRQADIDTLINDLQSKLSSNSLSPAVVAANQELAAAQAKVDEINSINAQRSGKSYTPSYSSSTSSSTSSTSSSSSTSSPTPTPTPTPAPTPAPTPVCTTSASGVTTCK